MLVKAHRPGFTIIELIIVIAIIGGLAAFLLPPIFRAPEKAKERRAKIELQQIRAAIVEYDMDKGKYPDSLQELVTSGSIKTTKDPWSKDYVYRKTPEGSEPYELYSRGKDGKQKITGA